MTHEQLLDYNERCLLEEWKLPPGKPCGWTSAQFCDEVWVEKVTKEAWTEKKVVKEGYYKSELVKEAWEETVWE